MSMKVDRVKSQRIYWNGQYQDPSSEEYQLLEGEVNYAVSAVIGNFSRIEK